MVNRAAILALVCPQDEPTEREWVYKRLPLLSREKWRVVRGPEIDGAHYVSADGLSVILSGRRELDGRRWLHMSVSRADRLPAWPEYVRCKESFLGLDSKAVQVIPPRGEYINQHPFCLHAFVCIDGDPLPDFRDPGGRSI